MSDLEAKARAWILDHVELAYPDTTADLTALLAAVRDEALEEAAKVCEESINGFIPGSISLERARRIRALRGSR